MKTVDYNRLVLKLYEIENSIELCHPTLDVDIIQNLIGELESTLLDLDND